MTLRGCVGPNLLGRRETYSVSQAFVGLHFVNEQGPKFREAVVMYKNLTEWVWNSKWYARSELRWSPLQTSRKQLAWTSPSELAVKTRVGTIAIRAETDPQIHIRYRARITRQLSLRASLKEPRSFDTFHLDVLAPLANFFSLATAALTPIESVHLLVPRSVRLPDQSRAINIPIEVEVLFDRSLSRNSWGTLPGHIPFGLEHVRRRLQRLFDCWFMLYDALRFPLNLFFSVHNSNTGYLENRFLSLVQTAESYHNNWIRSHDLSKREFKNRRRKVLKRIPKAYQSWVADKLRNDVSLRKRLDALVDRASETVKVVIPDRADVIHAIVRIRNDISHANPAFSAAYEGHLGLFRLIEVLSLLLQEHFLRDVGFSRAEASAALTRNWKYAYALRLSPKLKTPTTAPKS